MSKKKRGAAAPAPGGGHTTAQHTSTASAASLSPATTHHSGSAAALLAPSSHGNDSLDLLDGLLSYYNSLAADIAGTPLALERALWIHNVVLLVVQNVLMYDKHVRMEQLLLLLWTALWLGRAFIAAVQASSLVGERRKVVLWRVVMGGAGLALHAPFLYFFDSPLRNRHMQLLFQILLMEIVSIGLFDQSNARLTWSQIVIATTEALFATSIFSVLYNHKEELIYDRIAFGLTGVSAATHTLVLLTAKFVAFSPSASSSKAHEQRASLSQQRGRELIAELRHAIALKSDDEESEAEALKQKKRAAKSQGERHDSEPSSPLVTPVSTATATAKPPSVARSLLQRASVRVVLLMVGQALLLLLQLTVSSFMLLSWEITSVLMLSSSHVLWTLLQLQRKLSKPLLRPREAEEASRADSS